MTQQATAMQDAAGQMPAAQPGADQPAARERSVDCVVVGAGLAGLTTALELAGRGLDVVVLEARDRVGGRIVTRVSGDGEAIELGAQWINPGHDRMTDLVQQQGLQLLDAQNGTDAAVVDGEAVRLPTSAPAVAGRTPEAAADDESASEGGVNPFEVADLAQGLLRFRRLSDRVSRNPEWAQANPLWMSQPLSRWTRGNLRTAGGREGFLDVLRRGLVQVDEHTTVGDALREVDGRDLDALAVVNSGVSQRRVRGGMSQVCDRLAAELGDRVRLDTVVTSITRHDDRVFVTTSTGDSFSCSDVVVAVPPRVVGDIDIEPALPDWRGEVVDGVPRGMVIKAALVYERPWWRERGMSGQVAAESGPVRVMSDTSDPASDRGVLTGYFEGPEASGIGAWTPTLRERAFTTAVASVFGDDVPEPVDYVELDWAREPFTGGCHGAHFAPSVWTAAASALNGSEGHLHFAGAEYATRFTGYMEGALRSGSEVAAMVAKSLGGRSTRRRVEASGD